jgi:hypothetical protein
MTAWCLWWRVCADRALPVYVVEEERKKEASETGQRLRTNFVLQKLAAVHSFL